MWYSVNPSIYLLVSGCLHYILPIMLWMNTCVCITTKETHTLAHFGHTHTHTHTHTRILSLSHTHTHTHTHTHLHTSQAHTHTLSHTYKHTHTCAVTRMLSHTFQSKDARAHVRTHQRLHKNTLTNTHACTLCVDRRCGCWHCRLYYLHQVPDPPEANPKLCNVHPQAFQPAQNQPHQAKISRSTGVFRGWLEGMLFAYASMKCMCTHICTHTHTHIHTHTDTQTHTTHTTHTHAHTHCYMHTGFHTRICTHSQIYTHMHNHTQK